MRRTALPAIVIALFSATPLQAGDGPIQSLPRVGKWDLSYDNNSCDLVGTFGQGSDQLIATFSSFAPGDAFEFSLAGRNLRVPTVGQIDFGPAANPHKTHIVGGERKGFQVLSFGELRLDDQYEGPLHALTPADEANVDTLTIWLDNAVIRLQLGSMAAAMRGLRDCTTKLLTAWGFDPVQQSSLLRPPVPLGDVATWLSPNPFDHASDSLLPEGIVRFRLDINAEGKVTDCHTRPGAARDLADRVCRRLKSGRFAPAMDSQGHPVASFYVNAVWWL